MNSQVQVNQTLLPGVGLRYDMTTRAGRSIAVVVHRDGQADVCSFSAKDPDQASDALHLDAEEADALADMLGATRVTQQFADLSKEVPGLHSARLSIPAGSPYDGATLGETRARTVTGSSVVAVVRGEEVVNAPAPSEPLRGGDVLVAIGGEPGLAALARLLERGSDQDSPPGQGH